MKKLAVALILAASAAISFGQAVGGNGVPGQSIGGGAINPSSTGATTPGTGAFTTLSATSGITATSDGVHAGYDNLIGNTANQAVVPNTWGEMGPAEATYTAWAEQPANSTSAGPAANQVKMYGAPSGNVSQWTFQSVPFRAAAKLTGSAQAANIGSSTMVTAPTGGALYNVCWYAVLTQAATTSSTMPSVTIGWNDSTDHVARTINLSGYNSSTANATFVTGSQCILVNAQAATNVTIVGTGYASSGATPMQYAYTATIQQIP